MNTQRRRSWLWRSSCAAVLGYEALAFGTKERVPTITAAVRSLPRPLRLVVCGIIGAAIIDHFDTQRWF